MAIVEKEKWFANATGLALSLFFFLVGIPIWWRTTTVYRADLPYSAIERAYQQRPLLYIEPEIVIAIPGVDPVAIAEFGEFLQEKFNDLNSHRDYVILQYRGSVRLATQSELSAIASLKDQNDLDEYTLGPENKYSFVLMCNDRLNLTLPFVNRRRQVFIPVPPESKEVSQSIPTFIDLCKELFQPDVLSRSFQAVQGVTLTDKDQLRSIRFDSAYTLVFSLLVPQPDTVYAHWNISEDIEGYLSGLKETLGAFVDLRFKSQVLYYETLSVKPKKDSSNKCQYLPPELLPHIINPIEARLGSFVDTHAALNFLVYIPTDAQHPLYIYDDKEQRVESNSFLVPRWGGFMVYNVDIDGETKPVHHDINLKKVFDNFLPQIKTLLGFTHQSPKFTSQPYTDSSLKQWELDQWLRRKTVENIGTSTHALFSLSNLVQKIRNMVINDKISQQVAESNAAVFESYHLLSKGSIRSAFMASKRALVRAEKAFFDQSLLELLYFPQDQKFAIYIPLFLPIGLPLLYSTTTAIRWFFRKDSVNNESGDQDSKGDSSGKLKSE